MRLRTRSVFITVALIAGVGVACLRQTADTPPSQGNVPMRIVTDDLGRRVTIPVKITRAVSTAPSVTENIFAVGAGDRLVGVTTFCNYPEQAKAIPKVGDTMTPNMESIIALKPDVVFVSTASQIEAFMKTLEQNGIAVYVTNPPSVQSILKHLEQLGIIFGTDNIATSAVQQLDRRINDVRVACNTIPIADETREEFDRRSQAVRVFVQVSEEPLFTIGNAGFLNDLLASAGGRSVTASVESAYPKLSKETALALQPEAIIISESPDNQEPNEVFKNSPAVKNSRVYKINADLLSRPGPRLVDALEQIAKFLHPEKFPE